MSPFRSACFTTVTGVSGSGKSSLVSQALVELVADALGRTLAAAMRTSEDDLERDRRSSHGRRDRRRHGAHQAARARRPEADRPHAAFEPRHLHGPLRSRAQAVRRHARWLATRRYDAGRFSFNVAKGRCETCEGEGFVMRRTALPAERLCALPDLPRQRATTPRRWRSNIAARTSPTCWG